MTSAFEVSLVHTVCCVSLNQECYWVKHGEDCERIFELNETIEVRILSGTCKGLEYCLKSLQRLRILVM